MNFQKSQIPNYLTYFRVLLLIPIIVLLCVDSFIVYEVKINEKITSFSITWLFGAILFVFAAISDWLDGFLARKNKWISKTGKFLDPVADKIIINAVLIVLTSQSYIPIWLVIIFITRDIIVDAGRMILSKNEIVLAANMYGKLKTITQFIGLIIILFVIRFVDGQLNGFYYNLVQNLLIYLAAFLSILSGWTYIWPNRKMLFSNKD